MGRVPILIDADVHSYPNSIKDLFPYLSSRWRTYIDQSGMPIPGVSMYPKVFQVVSHRDTWPTDSRYPDGDFDFSRKQLLDPWAVDYAVLNPLVGISSVHNIDLTNALMPLMDGASFNPFLRPPLRSTFPWEYTSVEEEVSPSPSEDVLPIISRITPP